MGVMKGESREALNRRQMLAAAPRARMVAKLRAEGRTFAEIAELLQVSTQRAQQLAKQAARHLALGIVTE